MDLVQQFYPWRHFIHQSLSQGTFPLWNKYTFFGLPVAANMQIGLFFPLNILFFVFGLTTAFAVGFTVLLAVAGASTYWLLYEYEVSLPGRLVGASSFMLSDAIVNRLIPGHYPVLSSIVLIPLVFLAFERAIKRKSLFHATLAGLFVGIQILGGHAQGAYNTALFAALYAAIRWYQLRRTDGISVLLMTFIASGITTLLIAGVQLVPTGYFLQYSTRTSLATAEAANVSLQPYRAVSFTMPDFLGHRGNVWESGFYVGIPALLLAGLSIGQSLRDRLVGLYLLLGGTAFLLAIGPLLPVYPVYLEVVPLAKLFRKPARFLVFTSLSIAVLAGIGYDVLTQREYSVGRVSLFAAVSILIAEFSTMGVVVVLRQLGVNQNLPGFITNTLFSESGTPSPAAIRELTNAMLVDCALAVTFTVSSLIIIYFVHKSGSKRVAHVLVVLAVINLMIYQVPVVGVERTSSIYDSELPSGDGRVYDMEVQLDSVHGGAKSEMINEEANIISNVEIAGGYNPLNLRHSFGTLERLDDHPADQEELIDVLNIAYLVSNETQSSAQYTRYQRYEDYHVYRNKDVLPKAFFVANDSLPKTEAKSSTPDIAAADPSKTAHSLKLSGGPNEYTVRSDFESDGYLVISFSWYPQWRATVNGTATSVVRTKSGMMAIPVESGNTNVSLRYHPGLVYIGGVLSLIGIALVASAYVYERRRL